MADANELKILCCTCNMGNAKPAPRDIAAWIPEQGLLEYVLPSSSSSEDEQGSFDIIVIGMQEATWKIKKKGEKTTPEEHVDSEDEDDEEEGAKQLESQISDISVGKGSPRSNGNNNESDTLFLREQLQIHLGDKFQLLKEFQRGQMRLYVFVLQKWTLEIKDLDVKAENTGIAGVYHNKGGILVQFSLRQTRISFLTAHLAAHEGPDKYKARNDHVREILRGARPNPKHLAGLDSAMVSHHMFVMGDLNYRVRITDTADDTHESKVQKALELVQAGKFDSLYALDELSAGLDKKEVLCQFQTPPCHFSPTFKMLREQGFQYKTQRVPSYTDRILFTSAEGLSDKLKNLAYEPCPGFASSDHKPIRAAFSIQLNGTSPTSDELPMTEPVSLTFRDMKCSNLPSMDVDGLSDPYIMFVSDPLDLVKDDRNPKEQKKRSDKFKWPRTKHISKNLNPSWDEQVKLAIPPETSSQMNGAMLWLQVMDYDATSADDTMCSLALNLQDLVSMKDEESSKTIHINRTLMKYGQELGAIECSIDIQRGGIVHATRDEVKKRGLFSGLSKRLQTKESK